MQIRMAITLIVLVSAAAALAGCRGVGPQKKEGAPETAKGENRELYQYDLSKPDGPMYQMLRAAQDRDEELFRASFAPTMDASRISEATFRKFRKKVLGNQVTPVPESVQMVSDTEAVVKLRNSRGREIPVKVTKIDGKWLIADIQLGAKAKEKYTEKNPPSAAPAAPAPPAGNTAPAAPGKPA